MNWIESPGYTLSRTIGGRMTAVKIWLLLISFTINSTIFAFKIVIDPGHGGRFEGCKSCSGNLLEKDVALKIAQCVKEILQKKQIIVVLTRTVDSDFVPKDTPEEEELAKDLENRVNFIERQKPDALISIHLNSTTNKAVRGFEIYVPFSVHYPSQSYKLASYIHHALSQNTEQQWAGTIGNLNTRDRGIRAANFTVLRNHTFPAVLIELDYLTNKIVEQNYQSPAYCQKIATIIADAVLSYVNA